VGFFGLKPTQRKQRIGRTKRDKRRGRQGEGVAAVVSPKDSEKEKRKRGITGGPFTNPLQRKLCKKRTWFLSIVEGTVEERRMRTSKKGRSPMAKEEKQMKGTRLTKVSRGKKGGKKEGRGEGEKWLRQPKWSNIAGFLP